MLTVKEADYIAKLECDNLELKHLLTLAVARFRAGEKVIEYHNKRMGEENLAMTYDEWKHAVAAYDAAVKGEGR